MSSETNKWMYKQPFAVIDHFLSLQFLQQHKSSIVDHDFSMGSLEVVGQNQ